MTDAKVRRRVIRKGDVVVHFVAEEMEAMVCPTCIRPFCIPLNLAAARRTKREVIYCPVGHSYFLSASKPSLT